MTRTPTVRLGPNEKWRIEVDVNYAEQLRLVANLTIRDLAQATGVSWDTYHRMMHSGEASLVTIARLATHYGVQPGEMLIWFPVPAEQPDRMHLGKGRYTPGKNLRRYAGMPKRALRKWRPNEDAQLNSLRRHGFTWREIANRLRRTPGAVRDRYYTLREKAHALEESPDARAGPPLD